ncbi:MAG: alpha/beta hydrolase [Saprospiraceae bacterium]|nr:alpha/beta hydrolase [Saprospiraceae bacterium]
MKKILKWIRRILISIIGLLIVLMVGLYIAFFFWKKDVVKNLPQDSQVISTDKGEIEYRLLGNADRYMLMIHGSPGSVHVSGGDSFLDKRFSVLGVSRPGYYQTPLTPRGTPKEEAALYKSLLDELNINSVYVNGISGGGPASIQFALDYPERTAALILSAAVSERIAPENDETGIIDKFFNTEFGAWIGIQIALSQVDEQMKEGINWYAKRAMFPMKKSNDGYENDNKQISILEDFPLEELTVPTIIFHGDKDINVPFSYAQNASDRIPNATLFEMKGKDHFVFFSSYRDTINIEIMHFVDNISAHEN